MGKGLPHWPLRMRMRSALSKRTDVNLKCLFGKNGTAPLGDRFSCENRTLFVLNRQEKGHSYGATEWSRCIQTGPNIGERYNYTRPFMGRLEWT